MISPATECEGCGKQIGESSPGVINDYVTCQDGITSKIVTFHKACHMRLSGQKGTAAADPNLRRTFGVTLSPVPLSSSIKDINS